MDRHRASPPAALRRSRRPCLTAAFAPALLVLLVPATSDAQEVWRAAPGSESPAPPPPPSADDPVPEPPAAGQAALDRARTAWEKGDFDVAEPLYVEALEKGGLAPRDVLEAYVHLGSARAVLGKKAAAMTAFKAAAQLDRAFVVPPDAGKKASTLADQARAMTRGGPLTFRADIPDHVRGRSEASVDVSLDAAHASLPGSRIGVLARSGSGAPAYVDSVKATRAAHFDLPASLSLPSTTLHVRVDWLDTHANRLASAEEQLHVDPLSNTLLASPLTTGDGHPHDEVKHRGFWHTAWPYIIGSAALAAGGVAIYFATRTPADVNVTGVSVMTH